MVTSIYFRVHRYPSALAAALGVVGLIVLLDFFVVALAINRSLHMFRSVRGTWMPFLLIFVATYAAGVSGERGKDPA